MSKSFKRLAGDISVTDMCANQYELWFALTCEAKATWYSALKSAKINSFVRDYLQKWPDSGLSNAVDVVGKTALHYAFEDRLLERAVTLIANGSDWNAPWIDKVLS